jgi:glycine/D-amino acid oxidase-like deaminating enzyme
MMRQSSVHLPSRDIPLLREVDVLVAGGGSAGVAAAVSAARAGASVLLVERNGFLGGTMTATSLGGICGLYTLVDGEPVQMVHGFAEEVRTRLAAAGGTRGPLPWLNTASLPYDLFTLKAVLDDLAEVAGLEVLYQARLTDVIRDGGRVTHAIVRGREAPFAVAARVFVDASGDGELATLAGAEAELESGDLQFPSTMFRMAGVDTARAMAVSRDEMHALLERAVADGHDLPRTAGGIYSVRDGIVHLNITKVKVDGRSPDPFDPAILSRAEREGRLQARRYLEVFRRYVPGYEQAFVLDTGTELGVRETRRIVGEKQMTTEDVTGERKFEDAIAASCWPIEEHGAGRSTRWVWLSPGGYCQIPYGALVPRGPDNVLVAGRCLSATHEAQAALRVTANCFSMGQAAGIAAAMAGDGPVTGVNVAALQQALEAAGADLAPRMEIPTDA